VEQGDNDNTTAKKKGKKTKKKSSKKKEKGEATADGLNKQNEQGDTVLHILARSNQVDAFIVVSLCNGVDLTIENDDGVTPFSSFPDQDWAHNKVWDSIL